MKRTLVAGLSLVFVLAGKSAIAQQFDEPPPPPPDDADAQPAPPPEAVQPPAQAPSQQAFEQQLSPYGRWVDTPEYGRVWVPNASPDWQPYADGRWVDTAYGWTFVSGVPWGGIVFHYGRWGWRAGLGWYWVPGYTWGPAWVSWRWVNGYACWSPLAPRGYVYGRAWPGWVVVPHAHFAGPIRRWMVPQARVGVIVRSARPVRAFPSRRAREWSGSGRGGGWHRGRGHRH